MAMQLPDLTLPHLWKPNEAVLEWRLKSCTEVKLEGFVEATEKSNRFWRRGIVVPDRQYEIVKKRSL